MCGIAGILRFDVRAPIDDGVLRRMAHALAHRGPDDEGVLVQPGVGLVSRRLAVLDLSPRGHQPMVTPDGRFALAYNGEIYNFPELREALSRQGVPLRSRSDTEVVLHLLARDGLAALDRLRGMFAFAFWDAAARRLILARDRLGKKPLVYAHTDAGLTFASEAKAVLQDPGVERAVDPVALHHYLTYGYVPAPWSAFRGLRQLPAGHVAVVEDSRVQVEPYWTLRYTPQRRSPRADLVEELRTTLVDATRMRLLSDAPVGALLSGGTDSSAVVSAMRRCTTGRIRTFSVGFEDPRFDERAAARAVAQHLDTEHVELVVRPDAQALLPTLAWHYDQPLADSSAVPTMAIAEQARRHVTVVLSGDGGDEAFLGYERHMASQLLGHADWLPMAVRRRVARTASSLPAGPPRSVSYRARRALMAMGDDPRRRYAGFMTVIDDEAKETLCTADFQSAMSGGSSLSLLDEAFDRSDAPSFVEAAAHTDLQMYLPGALMAKVDIGSMAHSLEVRSPLLDHQLQEFAASVPLAHKLDGLSGKALLKDAVRPWLPPGILERPKAGFTVPLDRWFREQLREATQETLLDRRATERGYFNPTAVQRLIDEHATGRRLHHHRLWSLLVLEWWHRTWIDRAPTIDPPSSPVASVHEGEAR